jgi:hypothetical protein
MEAPPQFASGTERRRFLVRVCMALLVVFALLWGTDSVSEAGSGAAPPPVTPDDPSLVSKR